jgi:hypothetical protein
VAPPAIPLLPSELQSLMPLVQQMLQLQKELDSKVSLILGRVGDPQWKYTYDIQTKSLVPKEKKVTVTPIRPVGKKEMKNGN